MSLVEQLQEELLGLGITFAAKDNIPITLKECATLCEKYDVDAETFVLSWLAFAATNSLAELSSAFLTKFEREHFFSKSKVKKEPVNEMRSAGSVRNYRQDDVVQVYGNTDYDSEDTIDTNVEDEDERMDDDDVLGVYGQNPTIPIKLKKETNRFDASRQKKATFRSPQIGISPLGYSLSITSNSEKYGSRGKSGDVIFRYKCKDSDFWERDNNKAVPKVEIVNPTFDASKKNDYKYMFQKTKEVALALSFLMEDTSKEIFKEIFNELDEENEECRASLKHPSHDESVYLGRIRSDGKLTSGCVYFEGCLDYSDGHIVDLDLSLVDEYYLFPGQIVVLKGKNELGKCLRVSKVHVPKPLPFSEIEINRQDSLKLNIMVAVGPYTPSDSLQFEALKDLMKVVTRDKPDICILIGPFVEATHKMIVAGELADTFEDLFQKQLDFMIGTAADLHTKFLLVPSFKDVHGHLVYPTPPFSVTRSGKNITILPDPATVSIGGIVIGMTSTDILMHLSRNELANSTISSDRMGRLSRHVLSQRNFYPLYPCDESVPLDVEHWIQYGRLEKSPHILILPSDLRHFIKDVDGTIVVNPEHLTKSCSGGTYARIQVDLTSAAKEEKFLSIADFCVGEIIKI